MRFISELRKQQPSMAHIFCYRCAESDLYYAEHFFVYVAFGWSLAKFAFKLIYIFEMHFVTLYVGCARFQ